MVSHLRALAGLAPPQSFPAATLFDLTENLLFKKKIFNEQFIRNFFGLFGVYLGLVQGDGPLSFALLVTLKLFLTVRLLEIYLPEPGSFIGR